MIINAVDIFQSLHNIAFIELPEDADIIYHGRMIAFIPEDE
jgi:hypothetical protein